MKLGKKSLALVARATVLLAMTSCANTPDHVAEADVNKDNQVSLEELSDLITKKVFAGSDINKDGLLSFSEWRAVAPKLKASRFHSRDGNGDGKITLQEALLATRENRTWYPLLEGLDDDSDQMVDAEEAREFLREKTR